MKVLYHHRTLGDGAEGIHVSSVIDALRSQGHDVRVAAVIGEKTNVSTARTRLLTSLTRQMPRAAYELMEVAYSSAVHRTLRKQIASWRPDFIYERYTIFNVGGLAAARAAGIPFILEVNAPLAWERSNYEQLSFRRLASRREVEVCSGADVVIAVSTPLRDYLIDIGVPRQRIVVLPNAADATRFAPNPSARACIRERYSIRQDAVVIGFTGILRPWHGVEVLIRALETIRSGRAPAHALIVGDGPSLEPLKMLARDLCVSEFVTFTGRVPHELIPQYVAAFDIGISPRATFYASPMKIPEYMAAGVAVVGPRMPNIEDLITDGVDGALYEPDDVADLVQVIRRLAEDEAYRRRVGEHARASILSGRTWGHTAARIVKLAAPVSVCA
jgi:glycosyltransferase involved in cell wall biosynthesis